ncbi:hypothetical protein K505DRAFT_251190, partial [Melanomma pulvis-pyrius CBS 109.77]
SLPLGKALFLTAFTCVISALIVSVDAPRFSPHFIEDVAFRAAWITLAQVPLVFLLATKRGPLNVLAGLSYERVNWIHRWTGRILFVSATTHMGIMMQSISVSDIVSSPDKVMIIVRYGVGAYATLAWIALSSILPLRRWSYRLFYINHWVSTSVFLWVLFEHLPKDARTPIYVSSGIVLFDRLWSYYSLFRNNISIRTFKRRFSKFRKGSRQHIRLYLPKLGGLEVHPFTPATCSQISISHPPPSKVSDVENDRLLSQSDDLLSTNEMVLLIRSHSGLTRKLAQYHSKWLSRPCPNASRPSSSLTAYVDGPYGTPPAWEEHENLILIATSTGVSFPLSIMDYLGQICMEDPARLCTQRIRFIWTVRHLEPQFDATVTEMLIRHSHMLRDAGVAVTTEFYATSIQQYDQFAHLRRHHRPRYLSQRPPLRIFNPDRPCEEEEDQEKEEEEHLEYIEPKESDTQTRSSFESGVSSTLIDEDEQDEDDQSPPRLLWSQPSLPWLQRMRSRPDSSEKKDAQSCECPLVQSQREKSHPKSSFISRLYGSRPNIPFIIASSTSSTKKERVMVAVCSNRDVVAQARNEVARMNFEFVAGQREAGIEIFSESFA